MKPFEDISTARQRVLVVEDDRNIRAVLVGGLSQQFETLKAGDGQAALDLLGELDQPPDVVLTDVNMPRVDGFELAKAMRTNPRTAEVPIVMLTANADRDFKLKALDFGVDDYVTKPFDLAEVKLRIRNLAKVRQAQRLLANYAEELELRVAERTSELSRLVKELTSTQGELIQARTETIHKLCVACEYRDDDTAQHLTRMATYSRIIAQNMNLSAEQVQLIEAAAPMHDVGKIGVPDSILLKPAKLTPEEFKVMQQHPGIGGRILTGSTSPFLQEACSIAITHHEKWDGSGYPAGLKGEEIPLAGRIVALADVFDALTQKRVYKPAFSIEKSMGIIMDGTGKHFDPTIVQAFRRGLDEAVAICEKLRD
ncbi:MAG: response regulator [Planctomycetes bacterium]|nr:response regulator [Planctomycetota bacterium]